MPTLSIQITRYVDEHFPGFVECIIVDAFGMTHTFIEKAPVVSAENLSAASTYPCNGEIACEVRKQWQDAAGLAFSIVHTGSPWGIESTSGETEFIVFSSQIRHSPP
jgi:CubicO group peptidase (beta-lactamase class C family)